MTGLSVTAKSCRAAPASVADEPGRGDPIVRTASSSDQYSSFQPAVRPSGCELGGARGGGVATHWRACVLRVNLRVQVQVQGGGGQPSGKEVDGAL